MTAARGEFLPTVASMVPTMFFTRDPIENLELRVVLKKLAGPGARHLQPTTYKAWSLLKREKELERTREVSRSRQVSTMSEGIEETKEMSGDVEEAQDGTTLVTTFQWQQKVYGPREMLRYTHKQFRPRDAIERHCVEVVSQKMQEVYPSLTQEEAARRFVVSMGGSALSSQTDVDNFVDPESLALNVTTSHTLDLNPAARNALQGKATNEEKPLTFFLLATVDLPDDENTIKALSKVSTVGYQRVLCQIRVYDRHSFDMRPPFSPAEQDWMFFRSPSGSTWSYRLENASGEQLGTDGFFAAREEDLRAEVKSRELELAVNRISLDFDPPPPSAFFRVNVFGTLEHAVGFDCSQLFCEFEVDLPAGWMWAPRDGARVQHAVTHTAKAAPTGKHHLAFPFEFEWLGSLKAEALALGAKEGAGGGATEPNKEPQKTASALDRLRAAMQRAKQQAVGATSASALPSVLPWPRLFLHVMSEDSWGRQRAEGYGCLRVPSEPGCHTAEVHMWRPLGSLRQRLTHTFVGGSLQLSDIKLAGLPPDFRGRVLSHYGLRAEGTGSVVVKVNVVVSDHVNVKQRASETKQDAWKAVMNRARNEASSKKTGPMQSKTRKRWLGARSALRSLVKETGSGATSPRSPVPGAGLGED